MDSFIKTATAKLVAGMVLSTGIATQVFAANTITNLNVDNNIIYVETAENKTHNIPGCAQGTNQELWSLLPDLSHGLYDVLYIAEQQSQPLEFVTTDDCQLDGEIEQAESVHIVYAQPEGQSAQVAANLSFVARTSLELAQGQDINAVSVTFILTDSSQTSTEQIGVLTDGTFIYDFGQLAVGSYSLTTDVSIAGETQQVTTPFDVVAVTMEEEPKVYEKDGNFYVKMPSRLGGKYMQMTNENGTWSIVEITEVQWNALGLTTTHLSDYALEFGYFSGDSAEDFQLVNNTTQDTIIFERGDTAYAYVVPDTPINVATPTAPEIAAVPSGDPIGETIGTLAGEFKVDESGSATYSIPLSVPQGIAGVTPSVSLNYSSAGGNGSLGIGWGVSGLSAISRCRQTYEQDGQNEALTLTNEDRFCLDGQKLIAVSGEYGAVDTEYRTELDSQVRVISKGSAGSGPSYFTVERPDGSISYYGSLDGKASARTDSVLATADDTVMTWFIASTSDNLENDGNTIVFNYVNGNTGFGSNEVVIDSITYSGNTIDFVYRNESDNTFERSDKPFGYLFGEKVESKALLDDVIISNHADTAVKSYHLAYEQDAATSIYRVDTITECDGSSTGTCLPATDFDWHDQSVVTSYGSYTNLQLIDKAIHASVPFDLNGDGFVDLAYVIRTDGYYKLYISYNNNGTFESSKYLTSFDIHDVSDNPVKIFPLDIDGDSHMEIVLYREISGTNEWSAVDLDDVTVYTYRENTFTTNIQYFEMDTDLTGSDVLFHDVNGDALPDMVYRKNGNYIAFNNGDYSFSTPVQVTANVRQKDGLTFGTNSMSGASAFSFKGATESPATSKRIQNENVSYVGSQIIDASITGGTGTNGTNKASGLNLRSKSFDGTNTGCDNGSNLCTYEHSNITTLPTNMQPADFNNDGVADLLMRVQDVYLDELNNTTFRDYYWAAFTLQQDENGYSYQQIAAIDDSYQDSSSYSPDDIFVSDVNGDGLGDVLYRSGSSSYSLYYANGSGFEDGIVVSGVNDDNGNRLGEDDFTAMQMVDLNKDGQVDIIYFNKVDKQWQVHYRNGTTFGEAETFAYESGFDEDDESVLISDWDADGVLDVGRVDYIDRKFFYATDIFGSDSVPANKIKTITNGLDVTTEIKYELMTNSAFYTKGTAIGSTDTEDLGYGRCTVDATLACSPIFDIIAPSYLVSEVISDAPGYDSTGTTYNKDGTVSVEYQYKGLRMQSGGRGSLGFEKITTYDPQTQISTETVYHQDFPFIGMPKATLSYFGEPQVDVLSAADGSTTIAETQRISYAVNTNSYQTLNGGETLAVYLDNAVDHQYAINNAGTATTKIGKTETDNTYTKYSDSYVNLDSVSVETYSGSTLFSTVTTTNTYTDDNVTNWWLGRVSTTSVVHNRPSAETQATINRSSTFGYEADTGMLETETVNGLTTLHCYDDWGNETETITYAGFDGIECTSTGESLVLEKNDNDATTIDKLFRRKVTTYDAAGRYITSEGNDKFAALTTVNSRNALGQPTSITDINNVETRNYYDAFGRKYFTANSLGQSSLIERRRGFYIYPQTYTKVAFYEKVIVAGKPWVSTAYDKLGRKIETTTKGFSTNIEQAVRYDAYGRVVAQSIPAFYDGTVRWNKTSYDRFGRVTGSTNEDGSSTTVTYSGLLTTTVAQSGDDHDMSQSKAETKNVAGEAVSIVDAAGTLQYKYNAVGNLLKVINVDDTEIVTNYNSYGQKTDMTDPNKGSWSYRHNALGELVRQTSARNHITEFYRDSVGRTTLKHTSGGVDESISYVYVGHQLDNESNDLQTKQYYYDSFGRASVVQTIVDGTTYAQQTTYDQYGRIFQQFDADANSSEGCIAGTTVKGSCWGVQNEYNDDGYLLSQKEARNGASADAAVYYKVTAMDAFGNVTNYTQNNDLMSSTKSFDPVTGFLDSISTESNGVVVQNNVYTFDNFGNLRSRTNNSLQTGTLGQSETFDYDTVNRLTHINDVEKVKYYANGNIKWKDGVGNYCYNSDNPNAVSGIGAVDCTTKDYQYDDNGNMTSGRGRTITYSHFDKPTLISNSAGTTAFSYGTNRSRFKRVTTENNVTTTTYYIGNVEVVSKSDSNVVTTRRNLPGAIELRRDNGTTEINYLLKDHLGSLDTVVAGDGTVKQKLYFDAWGKKHIIDNANMIASITGSTTLTLSQLLDVTARGYTGHESVDHADIIHMNGRIYDATLGRFLQADPHIQAPDNSQSYNRYSYVLNNPLSYTDPSGYFFNKIFKKLNKMLGKFAPLFGAILTIWAPWGTGLWQSMAYGFIGGGVATGSLKGALIGAFSGAVFNKIGQHFKGLAAQNVANGVEGLSKFGGNMLTTGQIASQIASHAVAGGVISTLAGGKFGHGFFSAGVTKGMGGALLPGGDNLTTGEIMGGTVASAVIGGTASVISGGKFANGARTAAYQYMFNQAGSSIKRNGFIETMKSWGRTIQRWGDGKTYVTQTRHRPFQTAAGVMAEQSSAKSTIDYETTTHAEAKYVYGAGALLTAPVSLPLSMGLGMFGAGHSYMDTMNTPDGMYDSNAFNGEAVGALATGVEFFDSSLAPIGQTIGRFNMGYQAASLASGYSSTCFSPYKCN